MKSRPDVENKEWKDGKSGRQRAISIVVDIEELRERKAAPAARPKARTGRRSNAGAGMSEHRHGETQGLLENRN